MLAKQMSKETKWGEGEDWEGWPVVRWGPPLTAPVWRRAQTLSRAAPLGQPPCTVGHCSSLSSRASYMGYLQRISLGLKMVCL